jgi:D-alanyl-D-alanine carboxypeptidase
MDKSDKIGQNVLLAGTTIAALVFLGVAVYSGYQVKSFKDQGKIKEEAIAQMSEKIAAFEVDIAEREAQKNDLEAKLLEKNEEVDQLNRDFGRVVKTVNTLEKLSKTDKELLQKYSKVYFLNEHYIPSNLTNINEKYILNKEQQLQSHSKVYSYLKDMLDEAQDDKISINIISAYRSFAIQSSLKSNYKVLYGSGANAFSADQGFSEHQLGTTFDFTTPTLGSAFSGFESTDAYKWLQNNAHEYGFVLSYPKNNQYYVFEPWHWRFVGVKLATKLHRDKDSFYDVDQRDIDKYLINIFD